MHSARNASPVGFGGDSCFGRDSYFGGELCFGGEAGSNFGVVNGPRSKLLVKFRGLESPILQGRGTTHELRLVTLNCHRMVDTRRHLVAFHCCRSTTPLLYCCRSIASLLSLHYFTAIAPRSTASLLSLHASLLRTAQKEMVN